MDWNAAIERNREALKRVVAALAAMAGLGKRQSAIASRQSGPAQAADGPAAPDCLLPTADCRPTLPRHLHRAVLRLLRPAEAAARRLVIVAARDVVVALPPARPRKPKPASIAPVLRSLGIAVVVPHNLPHPEVRAAGEPRRAHPALRGGKRVLKDARGARAKITLPLFDPIRVPRLLSLSKGRPRYVPAHAAPRILSFDGTPPHRLPPPPSPEDPIDATRLALRLEALASALDDLPGHARRFARWRCRNAAGMQNKGSRDRTGSSPVYGGSEGRARPVARPGKGPLPGSGPRPTQGQAPAVEGARNRFVRISPLRPGRPPGHLPASGRRRAHEVHEVLGDLQYFAVRALGQPDTS